MSDPGTVRAFLGVEKSLRGRRWQPRLTNTRISEAIQQQHDLPEVLCRVLAARDVLPEQVDNYLNPTLRSLMPSPDVVRDLEKGAERVAAAITSSEQIGIIGDYDVDGMTSSALLKLFLEHCGNCPNIHIPHRVGEGYGPNKQAISSLKDAGTTLLITLDCGVMAHDPLAHAAEIGLETVIVDHHQAGEELPQAHAVINPNRLDDVSGLGDLCAAGVTFMLVAAINRVLRENGWWTDNRPAPDLLNWLDLVALGTVCDVVPLRGLNRAFVLQGLKVMGQRGNTGLVALSDVARLRRRPDAHALGFVLGPRLNAAGRIGSAMKGLDLLTASNRGDAMSLANELEELNKQRQAIELRTVENAVRQAEQALGNEAKLPVLIVNGEGWHPGVLGLVASRVKEKFNLPTLALGMPKGEPLTVGSGRSIAGVDLGRAIHAAEQAGVIVKGGGHAMAAGLTVETSGIGALRAFLEEHLSSETVAASAETAYEIDGAMSASAATPKFVEMMERAGPYGSGNPAPIFAFPAHRISYADSAGADHVRCTLTAGDGSQLKAIAFRALNSELGETLLKERSHPLHVAGRLGIDDWGGKQRAQLFIEDASFVTG